MAKTIRGVNDLASQNPELASEWHPTKNGELQPQNIAYASKKKVWWLGRCGHEWEAVVGSRKIGRGCPICAGIQILSGFNDLASHSEILTHEWDYEKNEKSQLKLDMGHMNMHGGFAQSVDFHGKQKYVDVIMEMDVLSVQKNI